VTELYGRLVATGVLPYGKGDADCREKKKRLVV
jgi:hypothetical protein